MFSLIKNFFSGRIVIYLAIFALISAIGLAFSFCGSCKKSKEIELVKAYSVTIKAMYDKQQKLQTEINTVESDAMERILTNEENVSNFMSNIHTGTYRVLTNSNKNPMPKDDTTATTCATNETYLSRS
jgi:Tfp pilus assembly protein PilO